MPANGKVIKIVDGHQAFADDETTPIEGAVEASAVSLSPAVAGASDVQAGLVALAALGLTYATVNLTANQIKALHTTKVLAIAGTVGKVPLILGTVSSFRRRGHAV